MSDENKNVDYQIGSHKLDTSGSIVDDEDVIEFDFESGAVFRRLADDIYESAEAGIREPLTNAITTVRRTFNDISKGVIEITVQDGEQVMLRLSDNGEGIPKSILEEVLTVIGRSNARDDGELSGQYGMGFLASYKLVGLDGGFLMCTNPRDTDEGPYSGLFKPGTFEPDENDALPSLLEEDQYGTVFEYYIRDDISIDEIRQWVEKHARWSPVPVIYQELDKNGSVEYSEDFYSSTLDNVYENSPCLHIDNNYYEVATSPKSKNDVILISSPVSMTGLRTLRRKLPWQVDLRLKYENGIVFKGPNEGLVPVRENEYEDMDDERQSNYIPKSELDEEDMTLPEPTGTREKLCRHREFLRHVNGQLRDKYLNQVEDTLDNFNPKNTSLQDLDEMSRHIMLRIFKDFEDNVEYSTNDIKSELNSTYNYDTDDESLLEFIKTMTSSLPVVSEYGSKGRKYPRKTAYNLRESKGTVFMCVSQNSWKSDAVKESDQSTHIVKVDSAGDYDLYEEHLGWKKLKSIKKSNATDILNISEEKIKYLRDKTLNKTGKIEDQSVTVHVDSGGRSTINRKSSKLIKYYNKSTRDSNRLGDVLVLFSRNDGAYISNHYELADNRCCVASCSSTLLDYLEENAENIVKYDDYPNWVLSKNIVTSDGEMTVSEFLDNKGDCVIQLISGVNQVSGENIFTNAQFLSIISDQLNKSSSCSESRIGVIEYELWSHIKNLSLDLESYTFIKPRGINKYNLDFKVKQINLVKLYMKSYLPEEIHETEEFSRVLNCHNNISKGLLVDCEWLMELYEDKNADFSTNSRNSITLPKHLTKDGKMTIKQIYNNYNPEQVIIHSLSTEEYDCFTSDKIIEKDYKHLGGLSVNGEELEQIDENYIYVPVLETAYKNIEDHIKDETIVLGEWDRYDEKTFSIDAKYIYATMKLKKESSENTVELVDGYGFDDAISIVDSYSQVSHKSPNYTDGTKKIISKVKERYGD